jgi:separase
MAVTQQPAESLAKRVELDLQAPATTSHITLNLLRALLGLDLVDIKTSSATEAKPGKPSKASIRAPARPTARKPPIPQTERKADFEIHNGTSTSAEALPVERRRALATQTFNTTLKQLSVKVEESPNVGIAQAKTKPGPSPQKVLQPRSPNRKALALSAGKGRANQAAIGLVVHQEASLQVTADCAIAALRCLVELPKNTRTSTMETVDNLLRGSQILLDRLISVGLKAQAQEQMWHVRDQLCARLGESTKAIRTKTLINDALVFNTTCTEAKILNIIITFQLQVLKVGSLAGPGFVDQSLLQSLNTSSPSNPVAMCIRTIQTGGITEDKAGQHLYGLSMILSRSYSAIRGSQLCALSMLDRFQLAVIMLTIRCHSWKMLGHKVVLEKELWPILSRALQEYIETCDASQSAAFSTIQESIAGLQKLMAEMGHEEALPESVIHLLVNIAQRSGAASQALALLGDRLPNHEKPNGLAGVVNRCRAATIILGDDTSDTPARLAACELALGSFKVSLRGTASELRDLLLQGARLRKAAAATALEIEKSLSSAQVGEDDIRLQTCSIRLLYAITRFVLRYTGQAKVSHSHSGNTEGQTQSAVFNSGRNTIDSVLSVMKCKHVRSVLLWDETESALMDCLELTGIVDRNVVSAIAKTPSKHVSQSVNSRISNIYWAWYLHDKDAAVHSRPLCLLLERSTDALESCTIEEKSLAFEVIKCDRLASCYQSLGEPQKARGAYVRAITASISQGALDEAMGIAISRPARVAWTDPKLKAHILGSCLRKLGRLSADHDAQKLPHQIAFFDDQELPDLHRAQVIEVQLFAIAELPATSSSRRNCIGLAKQILDLCQQPQCHVYRIRFIRDVLNMAATHAQFPLQDILDDELIQTACTFQPVRSASKCLLASYGPLLCLSVLLQWAFLTSRPSPECLRGLVDSTVSLLLQCQDAAELENAVDDPESLLRHISAAADYAGMLDLVDIRLKSLQAMRQILQLQNGAKTTCLATCLTKIATMTARLGDTSSAGRSFAQADRLLGKSEMDTEIRLGWYLAYAKYLINIDAYAKGADMIDTAQSIYGDLVKRPNVQRGSDKLKQESHLSSAALLASELAFRQGDLRSAVTYARQCANLTSGIWAALEKLFDGVRNHLDATNSDLSHASMDEVSTTTFVLDQSNLQTVVRGAPFWAHIDLHFRSLLHMSTLCAHCGLYPDAVYYATMASKMGALLTSEKRQLVCRVQLALLHAKGGHDAEANSLIKSVRMSSFKDLPDLETTSLSLDLASAALSLEDLVISDQYLEKATLSSAMAVVPTMKVQVDSSSAVTLEKQMGALTIASSTTVQGSKPRMTPARGKKPPASTKRTRTPSTSTQARNASPVATLVCPVVARLQETRATLTLQIQQRKGQASRMGGFSEPSLALPASSEKKLIQASILLNEALAMFSSDAVHCVLAETALAYPSKYSARRPSGRVSALSATTVSVKAKGSARTKQKQQRGSDTIEIKEGSPESMLRTAYELLASASAIGTDRSSSSVVHDIQKLFCRLSMLANAVGLSITYSPMKVLNDCLKSKDAILSRECFVLDANQMYTEKSELRKWPSISKVSDAMTTAGGIVQSLTSTFDDLPETWSVVSITLNDARTEVLLSRACSGTTPLILRIPLARSAIDETEENEFSFDEAKAELIDIIDNANQTAHDSRSQAEKAARKVWWAEREALDNRLETLLLNIENIWLGGFRGLLSQQRKSDEKLLARFSSSLDAALEQHLPSRQKTHASSTKKVRLHAHILDLFICLGHPDEHELDDALTDLLYFVVDVLQFEGERNAYDEIDFDAMLVSVLYALRSYHEACPADPTPRHTILILDKELHAFPWESLPCLLGKSVSRMPSMGMIYDRLAKIRKQSSTSHAYTIPSTHGSYILNPSSDLPATESLFTPLFTSQLQSFRSIIARAPTESEFESLLADSPLLLYFGHGSGAQYIRGRRIKALDCCAVTFLMGCSSGKMVECGEYESYGVPWAYMHAGSMAVVGTLWDVTDRDIDRFAVRVLREWGLVDVKEEEEVKGKEKGKKRDVREAGKESKRKGKGLVALDEAVNRGREACVLRYLNGAAVVMYGLPVLLE